MFLVLTIVAVSYSEVHRYPFSVTLLTFENVFLQPQGIGSPSVYHAVIVIFLEFFAWGLLTAPTLVVSNL